MESEDNKECREALVLFTVVGEVAKCLSRDAEKSQGILTLRNKGKPRYSKIPQSRALSTQFDTGNLDKLRGLYIIKIDSWAEKNGNQEMISS